MMNIQNIHGEPTRFLVDCSDPRETGPYLVDLGDDCYDGKGQCDCMDFKCHVEPKLKKGLPTRLCKHIYGVKQFVNQQEQP